MSDNFHFDLTGVDLSLALQVAFSQHKTAVGWAELDQPADAASAPSKVWGAGKGTPKRLVLFWYAPGATCPPFVAFPAPMGAAEVEPVVRAWLAAAKYGPQPDHDGDNGRGWRVYNEDWGHVAKIHAGLLAIEPIWLLYGK